MVHLVRGGGGGGGGGGGARACRGPCAALTACTPTQAFLDTTNAGMQFARLLRPGQRPRQPGLPLGLLARNVREQLAWGLRPSGAARKRPSTPAGRKQAHPDASGTAAGQDPAGSGGFPAPGAFGGLAAPPACGVVHPGIGLLPGHTLSAMPTMSAMPNTLSAMPTMYMGSSPLMQSGLMGPGAPNGQPAPALQRRRRRRPALPRDLPAALPGDVGRVRAAAAGGPPPPPPLRTKWTRPASLTPY